MKIGIIGAGNVGGTLGMRWAQAGHDVVFGSRNSGSDDQKALVGKGGPSSRAASIPEALASGTVILLATPWAATKEVVTGAGDFGAKILIDATNPILPDFSALEFGTTTSGAEQVAGWARGATVIKAFNTVGSNVMANPNFSGDKPVLFYCGDDKAAKQHVHELAIQLGFDAKDAGPLTQARMLEPFAMLWITLALAQGYGREIAFKFMRR